VTLRTPPLLLLFSALVPVSCCAADDEETDQSAYSVRQITFGRQHHLFGYIGHVGNIPWNGDGRYVLALRSSFQDHMPQPTEPAEILLLDTMDEYRARNVDETRGWNLQQGTMFYWNPEAPDTQFFFNDRDPADGTIFTVLFDISRGERVREFRFPDSPVANSGVAQTGGSFLALNYGRLARLRLVTGYAGSADWSQADNAPENDGIFRVDVESGERVLLVSYRRLREAVGRDEFPAIDDYGLFINHTLWNRASNRIYFYLRANFRSDLPQVNIPFTVNVDGTELTRHRLLGGHPEWDEGMTIIGADDDRQVRYDTSRREIVGTFGPRGTFAKPGGDIAMSPGREWFVNGSKEGQKRSGQRTVFTFFNRKSERVIRTRGFSIGSWVRGSLRIDPAPCWNRTSDQILFGALDETTKTRQLYVLSLNL
jgi:hypothetical protein